MIIYLKWNSKVFGKLLGVKNDRYKLSIHFANK